jgi:hypothetical protein
MTPTQSGSSQKWQQMPMSYSIRMRSINARSLTPRINDWLATSCHPRVLHVFDRACNLINERREVVSIVTSQIGNGPFNLVIGDDTCFSEYIGFQSKVSVSPIRLHLGSLTINPATTEIWNPRPNWEKLHARKGDIGDQLSQLLTLAPGASASVTNCLSLGDFDTSFRAHSVLLNHTGLQLPQSLASNLSMALLNADISLARKITSQLAGLGIGLTPAGDDYIMGAIYAVWIIHPSTVASLLAQEIAYTAAPLTTSLSAAWLMSAGRGEVGQVWHEFFDALISKEHIRIEESKKKILAVGETSGADAFAGFYSVFASWMENRGIAAQ